MPNLRPLAALVVVACSVFPTAGHNIAQAAADRGRVKDLMLAASADDIEGAGQLLDDGLSVDVRYGRGNETALMIGATHVRMVHLLLARGANPNTRSNLGTTPLMYACLGDDTGPVDLLLAAGADVNAKDRKGRTPLMFGALAGRPEIVRLLVVAGADPNVVDKQGKKALQIAIEQGHYDVTVILERLGATVGTAPN